MWRWVLFYLVGIVVVAVATSPNAAATLEAAPDAMLAAVPTPLSRLMFGRVSRAAAAKIRPGMSLAEVEELVGTKAVHFGYAPGMSCGEIQFRFAGRAGVIVVSHFVLITREAEFFPVGSPGYDKIMSQPAKW